MPVTRRGDHDRIEVFAGEEVAVIPVILPIGLRLPLLGLLDCGDGLVEVVRSDIADREDVDTPERQKLV